MGRISSMLLGAAILFVLVLSASAVLACPEGKSEILLTTPSGRQNTICVPDAAVSGIENAAENSPGTIIAAECPCWSTGDLTTIDSFEESFYCLDWNTYPGDTYKCADEFYLGGCADYQCYAGVVGEEPTVLELHRDQFPEPPLISYDYACVNAYGISEPIKYIGITTAEYNACVAALQPYIVPWPALDPDPDPVLEE